MKIEQESRENLRAQLRVRNNVFIKRLPRRCAPHNDAHVTLPLLPLLLLKTRIPIPLIIMKHRVPAKPVTLLFHSA